MRQQKELVSDVNGKFKIEVNIGDNFKFFLRRNENSKNRD